MANSIKAKDTAAEDFYQKWGEVKAEIERLRNYYEVDFHTAFARVRELKELANYYWDQYEKSRSLEPSRLSAEGQAIYQIWTSMRAFARELEIEYEAATDDQIRDRLKSILHRIRDRADDLWFDLERVE